MLTKVHSIGRWLFGPYGAVILSAIIGSVTIIVINQKSEAKIEIVDCSFADSAHDEIKLDFKVINNGEKTAVIHKVYFEKVDERDFFKPDPAPQAKSKPKQTTEPPLKAEDKNSVVMKELMVSSENYLRSRMMDESLSEVMRSPIMVSHALNANEADRFTVALKVNRRLSIVIFKVKIEYNKSFCESEIEFAAAAFPKSKNADIKVFLKSQNIRHKDVREWLSTVSRLGLVKNKLFIDLEKLVQSASR